MNLYRTYVVPRLTDLAMRSRTLRAERARWVPQAAGVVLEIGIGSGLNLPMFDRAVRKLYGLDPSPWLLRRASARAARVRFPVELLCGLAEAIPLGDGSVDAVVTTWTLCTVRDPVAVLHEARRVLAPDGRLVFVEHGRAPDPRIIRWQDRLTPFWRRVAGGCHLNRPIDHLLRAAGFEIQEMERGYIPGPRVGAYLFRGVARPAAGSRAARADEIAGGARAHRHA